MVNLEDSGNLSAMRTQTHIIDSKAVKAVMASLPDHWVVRELTERDYGIDLMVEIFSPGLIDAKGKPAFSATGAVFHVQIKGTEKELAPVRDGTINYSIEKKSLTYVERFSTPFFLFRVCVTAPQKIYFLWIQRYIRDVLDCDEPMWRETAEEKTTVRIPRNNELQNGFERIEKIAFEPKFIEELVEFSEIYSDVESQIEAIRLDMHAADESAITHLRNRAYRIRRLAVLLACNQCCISRESVDELIDYIGELDTDRGRLEDPPNSENFALLAESAVSMASVSAFDLHNSGLTTY